jgi:hypothetical protein
VSGPGMGGGRRRARLDGVRRAARRGLRWRSEKAGLGRVRTSCLVWPAQAGCAWAQWFGNWAWSLSPKS